MCKTIWQQTTQDLKTNLATTLDLACSVGKFPVCCKVPFTKDSLVWSFLGGAFLFENSFKLSFSFLCSIFFCSNHHLQTVLSTTWIPPPQCANGYSNVTQLHLIEHSLLLLFLWLILVSLLASIWIIIFYPWLFRFFSESKESVNFCDTTRGVVVGQTTPPPKKKEKKKKRSFGIDTHQNQMKRNLNPNLLRMFLRCGYYQEGHLNLQWHHPHDQKRMSQREPNCKSVTKNITMVIFFHFWILKQVLRFLWNTFLFCFLLIFQRSHLLLR